MWVPRDEPALTVSALPAHAPAARAPSLLIPTLPSVEHVLIDARDRQHVVVRSNAACLQLLVGGADVTAGPVALAFAVNGVGAISQACRDLARLQRILSPVLSPVARPQRVAHWTPTARRWRDALIALDARAAGATNRDIAAVLHGTAFVAANWGPALKERVRRHLARGRALVDGGYRALLG